MLPLFFSGGLCFVVFLEARFRIRIRNMRRWCIGNIEASQALAPGSTPGRRIYYSFCFVWGKKEVYSRGGLNSRPSACKADVITTRLLELLSDYTALHCFQPRAGGFLLMEAKKGAPHQKKGEHHANKKRGAPHENKKGNSSLLRSCIQSTRSFK